MLVLSRKLNQSICIGDQISIRVVRIRGNTIQLGIDAPKDVHVVRSELIEKESASQAGADQATEEKQPETRSESSDIRDPDCREDGARPQSGVKNIRKADKHGHFMIVT